MEKTHTDGGEARDTKNYLGRFLIIHRGLSQLDADSYNYLNNLT
jgi:hypothetical protein